LCGSDLTVLFGANTNGRAAGPNEPDPAEEKEPAVKKERRIWVLAQLHGSGRGCPSRELRSRRSTREKQRQHSYQSEPNDDERDQVAKGSH
jgi:hypothetical protein